MKLEFDISKDELSKFFKSGIFVLSVLLILGLGVRYVPKMVASAAGNNKELPIYCVDTNQPQISLTFDAAWGDKDTQRILDILKKYDVKVTFFMTGGWVEKYPQDVKNIAAAGHDLGNHSENHKQMSTLSKAECTREIMLVHKKVKELTGKDMILFRAPYGDYNNNLIQVVKECNYYCIQWDVDSLDWKGYDADCIVRGVCDHPHLGNGSIILCHNGGKHTADALETMILTLQKKGFHIVPLSQLIYKQDYKIDHEGRQHQ